MTWHCIAYDEAKSSGFGNSLNYHIDRHADFTDPSSKLIMGYRVYIANNVKICRVEARFETRGANLP